MQHRCGQPDVPQQSLNMAQMLLQFVASNYDQLSGTSSFDIGE
jgi:hypothetical protein